MYLIRDSVQVSLLNVFIQFSIFWLNIADVLKQHRRFKEVFMKLKLYTKSGYHMLHNVRSQNYPVLLSLKTKMKISTKRKNPINLSHIIIFKNKANKYLWFTRWKSAPNEKNHKPTMIFEDVPLLNIFSKRIVMWNLQNCCIKTKTLSVQSNLV